MEITVKNVETAIAVFNLLAEKELTIEDASDVLMYVIKRLKRLATVPKLDYNEMHKEFMANAIADEQSGE